MAEHSGRRKPSSKKERKKRRKAAFGKQITDGTRSWYLSVSGTLLAIFFLIKISIEFADHGFPDITKFSLKYYYLELVGMFIFTIVGIAIGVYGNSPED